MLQPMRNIWSIKRNMSNSPKATRGPRKKVFIGMSGGVDSSVSAALLVKAGYDVTGVFIKVWQPDRDISGLRCTWRDDRLDAMRVAALLGIPFITLDLESEYKKYVVDYMIEEYRRGRTPNPDVMCNKYVKFGGFFDWTMKKGADFVATGHYARTVKRTLDDGTITTDLVAGDDTNKDQSYFLWTLTQEQVSRTLFPVGDIEKPKVRELARSFGLPTAEKKDSQGLCFIGKIDVKEFLAHYIPKERGNVLDIHGAVIGSHDGSALFTIGERHGFIIDDRHKTPHDEPYYVVAKNIDDNTITVSNTKAANCGVNTPVKGSLRIKLADVNWVRGVVPENGMTYHARPRYRAELVDITVTQEKSNQIIVTFNEPQMTISPGQSLVIYDGAVCLGGGVIDSIV